VISAHQCRTCASDCAARAHGYAVSRKHATILLEMSELWTELAELADRYEAIVSREEGSASRH
jgi:hypothetical protein